MALRTLRVAGLATLLLGWTSLAFAQTDCKTLVPASPWGPNDQTGATNRVTPAVTKAAAAEIQEGELAHGLGGHAQPFAQHLAEVPGEPHLPLRLLHLGQNLVEPLGPIRRRS